MGEEEHAALLVQMWLAKQWLVFYGMRCPEYTIHVNKAAQRQTNGAVAIRCVRVSACADTDSLVCT